MKKSLLLLIFSCFLFQGFSQNIVTDSVFITFKPDTLLPFKLNISKITDNRTVSPKFVSYSQTKKFILIPVDQEISTKRNLADELRNSFISSSPMQGNYLLEIDYFLIERYNGRLFNPYILRADLPVYSKVDTTKKFIGTLSYNLKYKPLKRKTPKKETCEVMLNRWHTQLKLDLIRLNGFHATNSEKPDRLIIKKFNKPHFLNLNIGGVVGINFIQIEGELFFTRPETKQNQWFISNIVRYQQTKDFEMIGFGKKSEHFNKRFNENFSLDISSNFLIGLNKWKVTNDKTLYHLVNFSLSSNQSICFNKKNISSWKLNAGLFENFYYIISMKPKIQFGIYLSTGYKF